MDNFKQLKKLIATIERDVSKYHENSNGEEGNSPKEENMITEDAYDSLYDRYWGAIYHSVFKRISNRNKAAEITNSAFFQLWLSMEQITDKEVVSFLLTAVQVEITKIMKMECVRLVQPLAALVEGMPLPFAN